MLGGRDGEARLGIGDDVADLSFPIQHVDRDDDHAGPHTGKEDLDELDPVSEVEAKTVAPIDAARGERLLTEYRPGLELIRLSLEDRRSPYAAVLQAVSATLPPVQADDRAAVLRLAREGPPGEDVGLDPYGALPFAPPEFIPQPPSGASAGASA